MGALKTFKFKKMRSDARRYHTTFKISWRYTNILNAIYARTIKIIMMIKHAHRTFFSEPFSRTFTVHRTAGEKGGCLFNSSRSLSPASLTL